MNRYWNTALDVDQRMREAGFPYCVIKTYGANPDYNDSNIDVVTNVDMRKVAEEAFGDHAITTKDEIKTRFYETNKLMASHLPGMSARRPMSKLPWSLWLG